MRRSGLLSRTVTAWAVIATGSIALAQSTAPAVQDRPAGTALSSGAGTPVATQALDIAVFGNNCIDDFLILQGFNAVLVTDSDIATPGFLSGFDALFVTRDDANFGNGLSAAAVAEVQSYVGVPGDVVLFPGDWADMITASMCNNEVADASVRRLVVNAVNWAAAGGHGYLGEFNGAAMAFTTNSDFYNPLDLIPGHAGPLGFFDDPRDTVSANGHAGQASHPILQGVTFPFSPLETATFRTSVSAEDGNVVALWAGGFPAIVASRPLVLDTDPDGVAAGGTMTVTTTGGIAGTPALLFITAVNNIPFVLNIAVGQFDANCQHVFSATVPPGLSGITLTLQSFGIAKDGQGTTSNFVLQVLL